MSNSEVAESGNSRARTSQNATHSRALDGALTGREGGTGTTESCVFQSLPGQASGAHSGVRYLDQNPVWETSPVRHCED